VDAEVAADDARAGEDAWPSWQAWAGLGVGVLAVTAHSALSIGTSVSGEPILAEFGWDRSAWAADAHAMMRSSRGRPAAGPSTQAACCCGGLSWAPGSGDVGIESWNQLVLGASARPGRCIGSVAASALVLRLFKRRRGTRSAC
jgi:hypothetical protein